MIITICHQLTIVSTYSKTIEQALLVGRKAKFMRCYNFHLGAIHPFVRVGISAYSLMTILCSPILSEKGSYLTTEVIH